MGRARYFLGQVQFTHLKFFFTLTPKTVTMGNPKNLGGHVAPTHPKTNYQWARLACSAEPQNFLNRLLNQEMDGSLPCEDATGKVWKLAALTAKAWMNSTSAPQAQDFEPLVEITPGLVDDSETLSWVMASAIHADHFRSNSIHLCWDEVFHALPEVSEDAWAHISKAACGHLQRHISEKFLTNVPQGTNLTIGISTHLFDNDFSSHACNQVFAGLAADLVLDLAYTGKDDVQQSPRGHTLLLNHTIPAGCEDAFIPRLEKVLDSLPEDPVVRSQLLALTGRWGIALAQQHVHQDPTVWKAISKLAEHSEEILEHFEDWGRETLKDNLHALVKRGRAMALEQQLETNWSQAESTLKRPRM